MHFHCTTPFNRNVQLMETQNRSAQKKLKEKKKEKKGEKSSPFSTSSLLSDEKGKGDVEKNAKSKHLKMPARAFWKLIRTICVWSTKKLELAENGRETTSALF